MATPNIIKKIGNPKANATLPEEIPPKKTKGINDENAPITRRTPSTPKIKRNNPIFSYNLL